MKRFWAYFFGVCIISIIVCFIICTIKYGTKELTVYLRDGNSFASNWGYTMSQSGILVESDQQVLHMLGGDYRYWEFESIGVGEVTINYLAQYELEIVEEKCFSVTYYVDEDGTITELSSSNKPEGYDSIPNNPFIVFALRASNLLFVVITKMAIFLIELWYA